MKDNIKVQKDENYYYIMKNGNPLMKAFYKKDKKWKVNHMGIEKNVEDIINYADILKALKLQDRKEKLEKLLS